MPQANDKPQIKDMSCQAYQELNQDKTKVIKLPPNTRRKKQLFKLLVMTMMIPIAR